MFEVFDTVTGETLHVFKSAIRARECADRLNRPHLDKLYGVRSNSVQIEDEFLR